MLFDKALPTLLDQLYTPSTCCKGLLLFTPFVASGYSNSEIKETAQQRENQPNGLVAVLFNKALPRQLAQKGQLHLLQVALFHQGSICSVRCKWLQSFEKKRGEKPYLALRRRGTQLAQRRKKNDPNIKRKLSQIASHLINSIRCKWIWPFREKAGRSKSAKCQQHPVFPGGLPSKY